MSQISDFHDEVFLNSHLLSRSLLAMHCSTHCETTNDFHLPMEIS